MNRRTKLFFVFVFSALAVLSGCGKQAVDESTLYERIQKTLESVKTYEATAHVKYISNENENTYLTKQQCRAEGEYRIEVTGPESVAGNITVFDGKTICQYNRKIKDKVAIGTTESIERSEIFFTSFLKNYFTNAEVTITVSSFDNGKTTVLEAEIPGEHPYISSEKVWIDNETLKPTALIIYDPDGAERIVVTYESFDYNVNLDDSIFTLDQ